VIEPKGQLAVITDQNGVQVETFAALVQLVDALDRRFPDGNAAFQRVSRLCEEAGELAQAVNHWEGMGIKDSKYGSRDSSQMAKEVQDVVRAALGISRHYGLESAVERSIERSYRDYQRDGYL
jgi:NTP pyrophosphatase (non-canonical NTP hydrolase)